MSYSFVTDSIHPKKLCSRISSKCTFRRKRAILLFEPPLGGGLKGNVRCHLRLIEKRVVDFLLVIIELFTLGVMAEILRA